MLKLEKTLGLSEGFLSQKFNSFLKRLFNKDWIMSLPFNPTSGRLEANRS